MNRVKSVFRTALVYLRDNPGAVSFIVGEGALLLAKAGVNVTETQLTALTAVLIPLLLGYFHVAKKSSEKAKSVGGSVQVANTTVGGSVAPVRSPRPRAMGFGK